jgi:predicted aspartyl protease
MANFGQGVRQDYALALSLYKQAAEIGSPEALFRIGVLFANGRGVARSSSEAMRWYTRSAELGDALAQYNLALGYLSGNGVPKDPKRALFWMLIAQDRLTEPNLTKTLRNNINLAENQLDDEARKAARNDASTWKPAPITPEANPAEMRAWVGKYPIDRLQGLTFLERPAVQILINAALGSDAVSQMKEMSVVTPIEESSGWLIARGCQPHLCVDGQWLVAINLVNLEIRACLARVDSSTVRFGASGRSYIDVPRVRDGGCPTAKEALVEFGRVFAVPVAAVPAVNQTTNEITFIPLQKAGGTYVVPVLINNAITLKFVIDSGAADVSIPADVFLTLARTGTLQDTDFIGTQTYTLADGSTAPSATFRIRSLMVGSFVIENVTASIAPAAGPLLLGQSFLSRFKSWSIDNARGALILGPR